MRVEKINEKYAEDAINLANRFYDESLKEYQIYPVSRDRILALLSELKDFSYGLIENKRCVGVLAGNRMVNIVDGHLIFQEVAFYVLREYRTKGVLFFKEVLRRLKEEGYQSVVMACLHNSKTEKLYKFYQHMGFKPMETHFIKKL